MKRYIFAVATIAAAYGLSHTEPSLSHSISSPIVDIDQSVMEVVYEYAPLEPVQEIVKKKKSPKKKKKAEQLLTAVLFGECRGQSSLCMRAVGHVAMNRAKEDKPTRYGDGLYGVLKKRKAFSCLNANDPNRKIIDLGLAGELDLSTPDGQKWKQAEKIAHDLLNKETFDPTNGSNHYHSVAINPILAKDYGMNKIKKLDGHVFYRKSV